MHSRIILLLLAALVLLGVASCGGGQPVAKAPAVGALPTRTPRPTFTPQPTATQPAPTATQTLIPTPVPPTEPPAATAPPTAGAKPMLKANDLVNVRGGPGPTYKKLGQLQAGDEFEITGKNADGDWWQFDYNGNPGWVAASMVTANDSASSVLTVEAEPPPAPVVQAPRPQAQPQPQPKAQPQPTAAPAPPPAPATQFVAAGAESRNADAATFPIVTFWGRLGRTGDQGPISGASNYKLRVVGPTGTIEKPFTDVWEKAYPRVGQSEFLYNGKDELPRGAGSWRAVIVDGSGKEVSDAQTGTLIDTTHDVILSWLPR